mmetsp:Transcript_30919/g.69667  ORF Transcript_30919/g.69667 Transcript_30919/m.69667 type:complete len:223 (-) Transcript_30919:868-1536(-)
MRLEEGGHESFSLRLVPHGVLHLRLAPFPVELPYPCSDLLLLPLQLEELRLLLRDLPVHLLDRSLLPLDRVRALEEGPPFSCSLLHRQLIELHQRLVEDADASSKRLSPRHSVAQRVIGSSVLAQEEDGFSDGPSRLVEDLLRLPWWQQSNEKAHKRRFIARTSLCLLIIHRLCGDSPHEHDRVSVDGCSCHPVGIELRREVVVEEHSPCLSSDPSSRRVPS